jgi:hypothetical protein
MITTTRGTNHADVFPYGEPSYLLTVDGNAKTNKSLAKLNVLTAILHLSPADQSVPYGGKNMCPWATAGCAAACLTSAGRMKFDEAEIARLKRTLWFVRDRPSFIARLMCELRTFSRRASVRGQAFAARLNGTSDLPWERLAPEIFKCFPDVQFYDYTKGRERMWEFLDQSAWEHTPNRWPKNYHLTYSLSEREHDCVVAKSMLEAGGNVAAVFRSPDTIPDEYLGFPTVPADEHDVTYRWPPGTWLALRAKGDALKDDTGFVLDVEGSDAGELPNLFRKVRA